MSPSIRQFRSNIAFLETPKTRISSKLLEIRRLVLGMRLSLSTCAVGPLLIAVSVVTASVPCCADDVAENLPLWRIAEADCEYRVDSQQREADTDLEYVEVLELTAGNGTFIRTVTAVDPVRIVPELEITLPVKASRAGLQLLARVVLPRTHDPVAGGPLTMLVGGSLYRDTGKWRRLRLSNIPKLCDDQARVLRWSTRNKIDVRESYIDLVVVNAYGGKGVTSVSLANPEIDGQRQKSRRPTTTGVVAQSSRPVLRVAHDESIVSEVPVVRVTSDGDMLFVGKRPVFIRMIDYQGESFEFLSRLGFNTLRLPRIASESELDEARQHGLWIVCPPPDLTQNATTNYDRVLCWDVGDRLTSRDLEDTVNLVSALRRKERLPHLPLLAGVDASLHAFSRHVDVLLHSREPIGTALETRSFGRWLRERPRLARPGVLHWATIQTEPLLSLQRQWTAFGFPGVGSGLIEEPQLRQLAFLAVGAGVRGLHFRSRTQLDGPGTTASTRAAMLRLINTELDFVQPWVAGGKAIGEADTNDPHIFAPILHHKRAQLLCVIDCQEHEQYVPVDGRKTLSVTVPGAPVSNEVYLLAGTELRLLDTQRVAGGLKIDIPDFHSPAIVLLSREPMVINSVSRRVRERAGQVAQLRLRIVADAAQRTEAIAQQLSLHGIRDEHAADDLERASTQLERAKVLLHERDAVSAERLATLASKSVTAAQQALWQRSIRGFPDPAASPLCSQFGTLPWHWHLVRNLPSPSRSINILPNGDFEESTQGSNGWQAWEHVPADVVADVSLTKDDAKTGSRCLRLRAVGQSAAVNESVIESPLVWLNSPPLPVATGQIVRIQGDIKIPLPVRGSVDGVLIFDSLGGVELGYRLHSTVGWQPFVLYRATGQAKTITLTVALTGVGEALLDNVTVSPLVAVTSGK